jgi:GTP-binding protein EngB required for normal cell division/predicted transcriptional regulator
MKDEWKKIFNFSQQLYFGDLNDYDMLNTYYFEDPNLVEKRNIAINYISDEMDNSPILIGGDAGVGKSTFINNLISKHIPKNNFYSIILNVDNQPNNPIVKDYLLKKMTEYLDFLINGEIIGRKFIAKFQKKVQQYIADGILYVDKNERINNIVVIISDIARYLNSIKQNYPKLVIFLDQVEKFGSDTLITYISEYLGLITSSKFIQFIVCARKETIRNAKQSIKGFFSTYFKRFVEIESPSIEKILQKRFYVGRGDTVTIEEINKYFTRSFCDLVENISNNNIRIMLRRFEKIMESTLPCEGREGYVQYFSFLILSGYIDDLYKKINHADTIPLTKIVFDALQYYGTVDKKFYTVIKTKVMTSKNIKKIIGLTDENIDIAVKYLLDEDFIIDSFEIKNNYTLTKKGEAYSKFIELDGYTRIFNKNDDRFKKNIFMDQDFSK